LFTPRQDFSNSFPGRLATQGLRLRADAGGAEHGLVDGQLLAARRQPELGPGLLGRGRWRNGETGG